MKQSSFSQDANFYCPNPNNMFPSHSQSQQMCSTPNTGMIHLPMQHVSPPIHSTMQQRPQWVDKLFSRIDRFENKLNKLDQIDTLVTSLNSKVIESSTQYISNKFEAQKNSPSSIKTEIDKSSKQLKNNHVNDEKLSKTIDQVKKENDRLQNELTDVHMSSMRNNLIFYNIPENETDLCSDVVLEFCGKNLKIENPADKITIRDSFRLGKKTEKNRPIMVKFANFVMRDLVKKSSRNLKDSPFGISEQLPLEIQKSRKEKLPLLKELRSRDIKAYFVKDKIFMGGKENVKIGTRSDGGLAICCKTKLTDGISVDRELDCGIVIIKLKHELFNTANDIYIYFSYIPHEKSNFYNKCDVDFYDIIESVCLEYKEKGSFLVCGDLNSRIGESDDVLSNDNLHLPELSFPKIRNYIKWDIKRSNEYIDIIQKDQYNVLSIVNNITNTNDLNHAVKEFTKILFDSAHKVFGRSLLMRQDEIKVRPNNEWFDNNCAIARKDFHVARNFFLRHPSDVNQKAYVISRNNYNKMKRKAQFKYKRRKGIELCDLASTEPRKFWSSIKRKVNNKCKIDNETMMKHFESILGDSSQDLCEEVRNLIDNTVFDDINVTQLDSEDEIVASIKNIVREYTQIHGQNV
ncbi:unnamed protein product [Mytilus coruscus]|uniref:Endonuclease/exonuclease/phosphatase domain-containing protein n=1 Tax=Mytilus coruscus TaxID=42192 RepID=A0A6J8D6R7_MYTCO|nr:unnamed protein product [Mytilus coruscus]